MRTSSGAETTAPCELLQAVFSEGSRNSGEHVALAHAIINRATDTEHRFGRYKNTGNYGADVRGQASTPDIQGRGNNQYRLAGQIISGEVKVRSRTPTGGKWQSVVDAAEGAYVGALPDQTRNSVFWSHDPKQVPKANCGPTPTVQIGSAQFYACSQ